MNAWKRITLACLSLLVLELAPIGAAFAQVKVTAATPPSAVQGTLSLDVVVSGAGFDNTAKVQYFVTGTTNPGGITVKKVVFRNSKELVTTIDVADTALLANFDIQVTLSNGRKGKGTTLFSVRAKPNETPLPTYPPARHSQSFTSNGGTTAATSRLYMFGGDNSDGIAIGDLWSYANAGSSGATWTYIPGGNIDAGEAPYMRKRAGWSCGAGSCVLMGGLSTRIYNDTWIFDEPTRTWSQMKCSRRVFCPSGRDSQAMAYDAGPRGARHVWRGLGLLSPRRHVHVQRRDEDLEADDGRYSAAGPRGRRGDARGRCRCRPVRGHRRADHVQRYVRLERHELAARDVDGRQ